MPLVAVFMVYFGIFWYIWAHFSANNKQRQSKTIWQNQILDLTHVGH